MYDITATHFCNVAKSFKKNVNKAIQASSKGGEAFKDTLVVCSFVHVDKSDVPLRCRSELVERRGIHFL